MNDLIQKNRYSFFYVTAQNSDDVIGADIYDSVTKKNLSDTGELTIVEDNYHEVLTMVRALNNDNILYITEIETFTDKNLKFHYQ